MSTLKNLAMLIGSCVILSACSNGDGTSGDGSSMSSGSTGLLTGYYKDSEVINLPYECGGQVGVTGPQGDFSFNAGDACEFFLDPAREHSLRSVPAGVLFDDVVITETNPIIGQILQSADEDGDPSNGLTINPAIVEAVIADPAFDGIPESQAEADALVALIDDNNGSVGVVTSQEAQEHMLETLLTSSSFYQYCSGRIDTKAITKIDFAGANISLNDLPDSTTFSFTSGSLLVSPSSGNPETYSVVSDTDSLSASNEPLLIADSVGNQSTLYPTLAAAEAGVPETCAFGDITPPVIVLNGTATESAAFQGSYSDPGATATDNVDSTVNVVASGAVDAAIIGSYTITYTAVDEAGNVATQVSRTVNVTDQTGPVIALTGDTALTVAHGSTYSDAGASATDNLDSNVTVSTVGTVDINTIGSYTLTYSATDAAGNAATAVTRTVNVTDQTPPVITLIGAVAQTGAHASPAFVDQGASANDAVDGNVTVTTSGTVNTNAVGTYTLTYNATDAAGNTATPVTRTINITDQAAPVLTLTGLAVDTIAHGTTYTDQGATAADAVDGSLDTNVQVAGVVDANTVGTYTLTYSVSDAAGNAAALLTRTVNVTDQTAPVITLTGPATEDILINTTYQDPGATATDAVDGTPTVTSDSSTALDTSIAGTYTVTYSVTDAGGNAAAPITREVTVVDGIAFMVPSALYQYEGYGSLYNWRYGVQLLSFNSSNNFTFTEDEFAGGGFYPEFDAAELEYVLINGAWVPDDPASGWSMQLSQLGTVATVNGIYDLKIVDQQNIGGQSEILQGITSSIIMPAGSEKSIISVSSESDVYNINHRRESNGLTSNQYYQNLTEVIQHQCGSSWIDSVGNPNFNFISFTCGEESQSSGTLTGVKFDNSLVPNIGTWTRGMIPGTTIEAVITYVDPAQVNAGDNSLTNHKMFAMRGNEVWEGDKSDAGSFDQFEAYNQIAIGAIEAAVVNETVTAGTNEFQVDNGKLSLKSVANAVYNPTINQDKYTSANRYGYNNSNPSSEEGTVESFSGDINLTSARTSINSLDISKSTRSRIGMTHEVISQSNGYSSRVEIFKEQGNRTDGSIYTIFKAWHTIHDPSGNFVSENPLSGIHFEHASLNEHNVKMETVAGGWKYTAGSYTETLLASSFDINNDGTNEVLGDFLTRKARFDNYIKYPTQINDSVEGTLDNLVYDVRSAAGNLITITQDFDRYPNGSRPMTDALFNDLDVSTSTGGFQVITLLTDFDGTGTNSLTDFGGNISMLVNDPAGGINQVAESNKISGAQTWAGTSIGSGGTSFDTPIFTLTDTMMIVRVYSPDAGIPVRLKVENSLDNTISVETEAMTTGVNTWETLVFDFNNHVVGTAPLNIANTYDKGSIFFDFGTAGADKIYYWDDVRFLGSVIPTVIPPPTSPATLLTDFDGTGASSLSDFGGNVSVTVNDPAGGMNQVAESTKISGAETWAGTSIGNGGASFDTPIFTPTDTIMTVRVYSPDAGIPVRLKVENSSDSTVSVETEAMTTGVNTWETLTFDFSNEALGTVALDITKTFDKGSIFFDFGATGVGKVYYWDDVQFLGLTIPATPPPSSSTMLPVDFDGVGTVALTDFGGNVSVLANDPAGGTNQVAESTKISGAEVWAGTTIGSSADSFMPLPFTATDKVVTVRVYSPDANIPVRFKVETAGNPGISVETEAMTTIANAWETLTFDFTNNAAGTAVLGLANIYDRGSIFFDFGTTGTGKVYYWDDVQFGP